MSLHERFVSGIRICLLAGCLKLAGCLPAPPAAPCFDAPAQGTALWSEVYLGSDVTVPYFPDVFSNYWATAFNLADAPGIGLRLHGDYAYARYMSFNIYDAEIGTPLAGILDRSIQPNCGSENPFDGGGEFAEARSYVVHIVPEGTNAGDLANPVFYDADIENLAVLLRTYVPEIDEQAGVGLPLIEAFNPVTGDALPLPEVSTAALPDPADFEDQLNAFFAVQFDEAIRFYNINSANYFANLDNKYLATAIDRTDGKLAAIRFRPPIAAYTRDDLVGAQVRYWSLNIGGTNTSTYAGIKDADAIVTGEWVYFILGDPGDTEVMQVAAENGYNFIPWNIPSGRGIVLYRNLVTRNFFDGDIDRVPVLDPSNPLNVLFQQAQHFIGPYAPRGKRIDRSEFLEDPGSAF